MLTDMQQLYKNIRDSDSLNDMLKRVTYPEVAATQTFTLTFPDINVHRHVNTHAHELNVMHTSISCSCFKLKP